MKLRLLSLAGLSAGLLSSCGGSGNAFEMVEIAEPFEFGEQPQQQWSRQVDSLPPDISVFLAQEDDQVYVPGGEELAAFAAGSGRQVWRTKVGSISSASTVGADLVAVSTFDGKVQALAADSGELRWAAEIGGEVLAPAAVAAEQAVVQTTNGKVFALSTEDGRILWQQEYSVPPLTLHGTAAPAITGGQVAVLDSSCRIHMYRLTDGTVVWEETLHLSEGDNELERLVDADAQPVFLRQTLYAACHNGQIARLQSASGELVWKKNFSTRHDLLLRGNLLLSINQASELVAYDAVNGQIVWESEALRYRRLSDPVIWNDWLAVGDLEGYIHLFELEDGEQVGRVRPFAGEVRSLLSSRDLLYALSMRGELKAFAPPQQQ